MPGRIRSDGHPRATDHVRVEPGAADVLALTVGPDLVRRQAVNVRRAPVRVFQDASAPDNFLGGLRSAR